MKVGQIYESTFGGQVEITGLGEYVRYWDKEYSISYMSDYNTFVANYTSVEEEKERQHLRGKKRGTRKKRDNEELRLYPHVSCKSKKSKARVWIPKSARPNDRVTKELTWLGVAFNSGYQQWKQGEWSKRQEAATKWLQRNMREWPLCRQHGEPMKLTWKQRGKWCKDGWFECSSES